MPAHYKYVCIGGGNAAGYVARAFVESGKYKPHELCIIGDEPVPPYERPALSKAYLWPEGFARLPGFHTSVGGGGVRQDEGWYLENGVDFRVHTKVAAADLASSTLTLDSGDTVTYDKLIIATGGRPIKLDELQVPGADLNVYYLRNVKDADALVAAIKACKEGDKKAVVLGGGYIGMEAAACLQMWELDVTMVFPDDRLMQRLMTPELAAFYEQYYQSKGIKIIKGPGAKADRLVGSDGKVTSVVLDNGMELPASLVLAGIGARPNSELFAGQVAIDPKSKGIIVDATLRTSVPNVYAVGDVASFPLKLNDGSLARQEHVTHCRMSAMHAVGAILGSNDEYDYMPFFYSREFSLSWQFYGLSEGRPVHFGERKSGQPFGAYWVQDGRVVGAFLESGTAEQFQAIQAVAEEQPAVPAGGVTQLAEQGLLFAKEAKEHGAGPSQN